LGNWTVRFRIQLPHAGIVLLDLSQEIYCQKTDVSFSLKHALLLKPSFVLLASTHQSLYVMSLSSLLYIFIVIQVCTHQDISKDIVSISFHEYKNFESEYHTIVLSDLLIFVIQKKPIIKMIIKNNNLLIFIVKILLKTLYINYI